MHASRSHSRSNHHPLPDDRHCRVAHPRRVHSSMKRWGPPSPASDDTHSAGTPTQMKMPRGMRDTSGHKNVRTYESRSPVISILARRARRRGRPTRTDVRFLHRESHQCDTLVRNTDTKSTCLMACQRTSGRKNGRTYERRILLTRPSYVGRTGLPARRTVRRLNRRKIFIRPPEGRAIFS